MDQDEKKNIFGPPEIFGSKLPEVIGGGRLAPPAGRQAAYNFAGFDPEKDVDPTTGRLKGDTVDSMGFEARAITRIYPPQRLIYAGRPISRITCHYKVSPFLRAALQEIDKAGRWEAVLVYGGGFEPRLIRGGTDWSLHTLGLAWDFDPARNPLGAPPAETYLGSSAAGAWVVDCFGAWGFFWGGHFADRSDCMHFQWATGC